MTEIAIQTANSLGGLCREQQRSTLFRRHLQMTYDSFCTLLERIRFHLKRIDEEKAASRGEVIIHELYLYAAVRFLAGASYANICFFCVISKLAFYCILWRTIHAINLAIPVNFPTSPEDCAALAADFEKKSYNGVISNCVGALDGYLYCKSRCRTRNMQGMFDHTFLDTTRGMVSTSKHVVMHIAALHFLELVVLA
jgi:hypothetical protein